MRTPVPMPVSCGRNSVVEIQPLVAYAADRMAIAMNLITPDADAIACRIRLCRFFRDISARACSLGLGGVIVAMLDGTDHWEYPKIGYWMDGQWSSRKTPMINLLVRLQMTRPVIEAASWLHDRGRGVVLDDDDTRSGRR